MSSRVKFEWDSSKLRYNIQQVDPRTQRAVSRAVDYHGFAGEAYMKMNAPWTDRTGAARTGLHTTTSHTGSGHEIVFAHSVHYGIWLEVKYSGRDQIIMPAVLATGKNLMQALRGMISKG